MQERIQTGIMINNIPQIKITPGTITGLRQANLFPCHFSTSSVQHHYEKFKEVW